METFKKNPLGKNLQLISLVAICFVSFLLLVPYRVYQSGQTHYFLYPIHRLDPGFLGHDWLIAQTPNPHPFFSLLIASFTSRGNLPLWLFSIHIAQFFFFTIGILTLSRVFTNDFRVPLLVTCFLLFYFSQGLGQSTLFSQIVQPEDLAKVFYLFSLTALLENQVLKAWFFLGLTVLFDIVSGVGGFFLLSLFLIFQRKYRKLQEMVPGIFLFLLLGSPNLTSIIRNFSPFESSSHPELGKLLFNFRGPHHYRIATFEVSHVFRTLLPLFALFLNRGKLKKLQGNAALYAALSLFLCLLAVFSIEGFYLPTITQLRFFRLSPFLLLLGLIFLSLALIDRVDEERGLGLAPVVLTLTLSFLERDSRLFIPLAVFVGLVWWLWTKIQWESLGRREKALLAIFLPALLFSFYALKNRGMEFSLHFLLSLFLCFLLRIKPRQPIPQIFLMAAFLTVPAFLQHSFFPERISIHLPRAAPSDPDTPRERALRETLEWIRLHTASEAVLLTPPYLDGIRFFTERAIVVDFQANPYRMKDLREWKERLETVSQASALERWVPQSGDSRPQREFLRRGYLNLSAIQVEKIARKYQADYFLTEAEDPKKDSLAKRGHRLVFANSSYRVFLLSEARSNPLKDNGRRLIHSVAFSGSRQK